MPTTPTYSPPPPQNSAECLRPYPHRYARYAEIHPVPPLKGHPKSRTASVSYRASVPAGHDGCGLALSYRASSPDGARLPFRITATHTYGVRHLPCDPIATEPCRPTACGGEHPCCTVAYTTTANYSLLTANWSFTFSAKERDPETGLSYFGSRYYSSDLSIWLSVDPMSDKYASLSPYVYCADNPVRLVDPNGEEIDDNFDKWKYNKDTKELTWLSNKGGKCHQTVVETENTYSGERVFRTVEFDGAIGRMFDFSVVNDVFDGLFGGALEMAGGATMVGSGATIGVGGSILTGGATVPIGGAVLGTGAYLMYEGLVKITNAIAGRGVDMYEQQDLVIDVLKSTGSGLLGVLSEMKHKPFTETLKNTFKSVGKAINSFSVSVAWSSAVRYRTKHPKRIGPPSGAKVY